MERKRILLSNSIDGINTFSWSLKQLSYRKARLQATNSWFQPRDEAAMLVVNTTLFFKKNILENNFRSRQRNALFLTIDVVTMTSHTNQQFPTPETFGAMITGIVWLDKREL